MPIFKEVNESYFGPQTLRNVLNYVLRSGDVGGLAVDPAHAHEQMLLVKQIWNKLGGRQIRHFIVSFAPHEFLLPDDARTYAYQIARYYSAHYCSGNQPIQRGRPGHLYGTHAGNHW